MWFIHISSSSTSVAHTTDKLIVFFTNVKNQFKTPEDDEFADTLRSVSSHNAAKGNSVVISAYYVGEPDVLGNKQHLRDLVDQNIVSQMGLHCPVWIFI